MYFLLSDARGHDDTARLVREGATRRSQSTFIFYTPNGIIIAPPLGAGGGWDSNFLILIFYKMFIENGKKLKVAGLLVVKNGFLAKNYPGYT